MIIKRLLANSNEGAPMPLVSTMRMQQIALGDPLDCRDRTSIGVNRKREAGAGRLAVEQDIAGAVYADETRCRRVLVRFVMIGEPR